MRGLKGKKVLVTGAESGIGRAIAVRFFQEGCHIAVDYLENRAEAEATADMARRAEPLHDEPNPAEQTITLIQGDVSQEADVANLIRTTIADLGGLDILVNNAGIVIGKPSHELEMDLFDKVMNVNLRGAFMCARAAIQSFLETGTHGVIINISSVHEVIPKPMNISYSTSKGATGNLTRTLALEYAGQGIRVNAVAPGATVTPMNSAWIDDPARLEEVTSHIPLGRPGYAEEMAAATAFLASDEAAYITGQTLYVDGGLTLYADFRTSWASE